ncbi:MAG: peptide-methionine (S)-S-oxide reductase MsrA [Cetobacterium sp.]
MKRIFLGGGCFWGLEAYFKRVKGIEKTSVGYLNSKVNSPTYQEVCSGETEAVEALMVEYDENIISLEKVLNHFFKNIDPTTLDKQGHDIGTQYRSGIYYLKGNELEIIRKVIENIQREYSKPIVTEVKEVKNFYPAEEYHQAYLEKNPGGYCHNLGAILDLKKTEEYNGK